MPSGYRQGTWRGLLLRPPLPLLGTRGKREHERTHTPASAEKGVVQGNLAAKSPVDTGRTQQQAKKKACLYDSVRVDLYAS